MVLHSTPALEGAGPFRATLWSRMARCTGGTRWVVVVALLAAGLAQAAPFLLRGTDFVSSGEPRMTLTRRHWAHAEEAWSDVRPLRRLPQMAPSPGLFARMLVLPDLPAYAMPVMEVGVLIGPFVVHPLPGDSLFPFKELGGRMKKDAMIPGDVSIKVARITLMF